LGKSTDIHLKDKIFSKEHIIKIGNLVYEYHKSDFESFKEVIEKKSKEKGVKLDPKDFYNGRFSMTIKYADGIVDTDSSMGFLTKTDTIDFKKINAISFSFIGYDFLKTVEIRLEEGDFKSNYIHIASEDNEWFKSVVHDFKEITSHIPPQSYVYRYKFAISVLFALLFLIINVFSLIQLANIFSGLRVFLKSTGFVALFSIISGIISSSVGIWIKSQLDLIWCSIEFDFGPKHFKKKTKKTTVRVTVISVIFPIILFVLGKL